MPHVAPGIAGGHRTTHFPRHRCVRGSPSPRRQNMDDPKVPAPRPRIITYAGPRHTSCLRMPDNSWGRWKTDHGPIVEPAIAKLLEQD